MVKPRITFDKSETTRCLYNVDANNKVSEMENDIRKFFLHLEMPSEKFDASNAFDELKKYVNNYDRMLYSTISNIIYAHYDKNESSTDPAGTLLSNLDALLCYSENENNILAQKSNLAKNQTEKCVDDTRRIILKIWDHVTLASQQYTMLKQSDSEYDIKFKQRFLAYKEEMSKEMNAQMITMVGIFTALAFLVFGSISSLDGVFENISIPLFKLMSVGVIWGICISNMIFVFLYCIGKMTKLNFKANQSKNATIFQRYPVVCWTNFILVTLLLFSIWGWFLQGSLVHQKIMEFTNHSPWLVFIIGTIFLLLLVIIALIIIRKRTKFIEYDK